jgi:hypothetical protein
MTRTRGIRNNNPGNIRYNKEKPVKWLGLDTPPSDGTFCRFAYAKYGIRALAKILLNYQDKYGLDTIRKIINRYAPESENDTDAYVKSVSNSMGIGADVVISVYGYRLWGGYFVMGFSMTVLFSRLLIVYP